jgi:YbbR domain-containing protein
MPLRFTREVFASREQLYPFAGLWLRKIFLEDWSTKLIALAISLALWFVISGQQAPITSRFNEVKLKLNVPGEMEISNEPSRQVEITLTGDKGKLDLLDASKLVIGVDLSNKAPGEWLVDLKPDDVIVELPAGVKIDEIQPGKVLVKLEPREEREIEVKAEFEGQLPEGMEIYTNDTVVTPAKIRVRGPSSFVNSIDSVSTEKIPLENRKANFTARQVAVNLLNPKITVLDTVVDVNVTVGPKRSERTFIVKAADPSWAAKDFSVTLLGAAEDLEKIKAADLTIVFEKIDDHSARCKLVLPPQFVNVLAKKTIKPDIVMLK